MFLIGDDCDGHTDWAVSMFLWKKIQRNAILRKASVKTKQRWIDEDAFATKCIILCLS